jgi:hypothetical protein
LTWAIALRKFPKVRANLFLSTSLDEGHEGDFLISTNDNSTPELIEALNKGANLWLSQLSGSQVAYLDPISGLNINALLAFSFTLTGRNTPKKYSHDARPIIPLIKLDGSTLYREITKTSLFNNHIILCHAKWEEAVNSYLEKHARPGFEIFQSDEAEGVPTDWALFANVELIRIASEDVSNNLQCLVPVSEGEYIHFTGGLKLAPGVWHAMAPPEIFATDGSQLLNVHVKNNVFHEDPNQEMLEISSKYNPDFLKGIGKSLDSKNLILCSEGSGKSIEKDISFRSAITPRKLITYRNVELFYTSKSGDSIDLFGATSIKESIKNNSSIRGMSFHGPSLVTPDLEDLTSNKAIELQFEDFDEWKKYDSSKIKDDLATCIVRGYHVWDVAFDSSSMTCTGCKQYQIVRKKGRKKNNPLIRPQASVSNWLNHKVNDLVEKKSNKISIDIAYDAICYLGSGTWNNIQSILSETVDLPWQVSITNQNLVDLCYIDQSLKKERFIPSEWSCSPPSLTITENGKGFISGFRNDLLISSVNEALLALTNEYYSVKSELNCSPTGHFWNLQGLAIDEIKSATSNIKDPHGRNIEIQLSPGNAIAASLPFISDILNALPQIHIDDRSNLERFDLKSGKWVEAKIAEDGAYRTNFAGRRYFFYEKGISREASHELVKLIAARNSGVYLHQYNLNNLTLECVIGCDPPGLFRRALVSCSGTLPINKNGKTVYSNVPKSLAKLIMYKIYK